eukprot:5465047-Pyramimonas_sp.AAC.1
MRRVYRAAERAAALVLKVAKCHIVPLAAEFSPELADRYRTWLREHLPEWQDFAITPVLKYLGLWLGPQAKLDCWIEPLKKWRTRGHLLSISASPHRIMSFNYHSRA